MLRELQKLVTDERSAKENLEHELQQSQDQIKALKLAGTYNAEYEIRVRDLNSELANKNKILELTSLYIFNCLYYLVIMANTYISYS